MRRNYFAKLVNYFKNVYHIEKDLNRLNDRRLNPTYKRAQVIMPVLLSFLLRVRSLNALNLMVGGVVNLIHESLREVSRWS